MEIARQTYSHFDIDIDIMLSNLIKTIEGDNSRIKYTIFNQINLNLTKLLIANDHNLFLLLTRSFIHIINP